MKIRIITLLLTIVILAGFINTLNAQPKERLRAAFKDELNLTPEQEKQIDALKYEHEKLVLDKKNEIEKNRLEIRHMMNSKNVDADLLKNLTGKNSDIQAELKQMHIDHWLKVYNLLDDNQKDIWRDNFGHLGQGRKNGMRRFCSKDRDFDRECLPQRSEARRFHRNF